MDSTKAIVLLFSKRNPDKFAESSNLGERRGHYNGGNIVGIAFVGSKAFSCEQYFKSLLFIMNFARRTLFHMKSAVALVIQFNLTEEMGCGGTF